MHLAEVTVSRGTSISLKDTGIKNEIVEKSCKQKWMLDAPVFITVCAELNQSEKRYGERGRNLYAIQDTAAAIQNILLCAADLGLGTCWCGAFDESELSDIIKISDNMRPVAIIPVGYPVNEKSVMPKRKPFEEICTFIGDNVEIKTDNNNDNINKFEHCDMSGTVFNDVNLNGSSFSNINLSNIDISDANLSGGKIYECNLSNFNIYNCKLDGMTINGKDIVDLLSK